MPANAPNIELSGHTIAGLIDAEASFQIAEQNGGASLACSMTVAMRDDDVEVLHGIARATGLGVVRAQRQARHPQACWSVFRKDDAVELASFLMRNPLRSRKRKDFDVWKAAVERWAGSDPDRVSTMRILARQLREARRFSGPDAVDVVDLVGGEGFYDWLGGFIAGDGHLGINQGRARLTVKLRADDTLLLAALRDLTGSGTVHGPYRNRAAHPSVVWNVTRNAELVDLARRLAGRVPGRKQLEFEVWRTAVESPRDAERVAAAASRLRDLRLYRPGTTPASRKNRRVQRMYEQNCAWLPLLRRWAEQEPGPLTGTGYDRWRPPGSPTRNTLAVRFGSWYDALDAARLADRAAVTPELRDARVRSGEERRAERRLVQRERTIAAVKRCATAVGRFPGPTEYARWRLHNEPTAPSFVTGYKLFGGWPELRAACEARS